jgi:hypothetical protein
VIPEDRRIKVLRRGTWVALKGTMPAGGQMTPTSKEGASLLWKKAQKNEKKKRTSDAIKSIIPQRSPRTTIRV